MVKAEIDRQLMVRVDNTVGMLAQITNLIASSGINMSAICAYSVGKTCALMLVTEDNNATKKVLEEHNFQVEEEEVILLTIDNKPGALQNITNKIAQAGIDLNLIYGTADNGGDICRIVIISPRLYDIMLIINTEIKRA